MGDFLPYGTIELPCPSCGHKTAKKITWINTHDEYVCDECHKEISLASDSLMREVRGTERRPVHKLKRES